MPIGGAYIHSKKMKKKSTWEIQKNIIGNVAMKEWIEIKLKEKLKT